MKYLDYPQFAELSRALTFTSSECTVFTRIEAYSCKPVTQEKPLYRHIQRTYAPEAAARKYGQARSPDDSTTTQQQHDAQQQQQARASISAGSTARGAHETAALSPSAGASTARSPPQALPPAAAASASPHIPPHLAESPFGNLTESSAARKLLFTIIATLNAAFPDHDFADIPVSTFRREPSPAYVVHSLSSTLQSLRRSAAGNNPDAPAAAATSPPVTARSTADSASAFFSAAPRTFAGLPTSFDSTPAPFAIGSAGAGAGGGGGGAQVQIASSRAGFGGSPSIAATLSPPGQMAQLSLNGAGPSSLTAAVSPQPPAMALPPAISNAQAGTYSSFQPSAARPRRLSNEAAFGSAPASASASGSRNPISPRLGAATSPRIGSSAGSGAGGAALISPPLPAPPPSLASSSSLPQGGNATLFSPSALPAAITAATHPALASILDDIMCVEECEVYSFHPDIEYDPHASADDDEERLLLEAAGVEGVLGDGGLGLFEDEDGDVSGKRGRGIDIGSGSGAGGAGALGISASGGATDGLLGGSSGSGGRRTSKSAAADALLGAYERDELEDIAEWGEEMDDDYDDDDAVEDVAGRGAGASSRATRAGGASTTEGSSSALPAGASSGASTGAARRRGPDVDGDEEMADGGLLFDEDVYGQGLSGTQTPREGLSNSGGGGGAGGRPDLISDTSSSSFFSQGDKSADTDGADVAMGGRSGSLGTSGAKKRLLDTSSPVKKRVFGPADRSGASAWGRAAPRPSASQAVMLDDEDDDDEDEDEDLGDAPYHSDSSGRSPSAEQQEDDDDAAGLLWATYAFFYNKRLKRVLFVNVWARTNAGVEAHAAAAAAAAAAARIRERASAFRMSTSPRAGGFGSFGGSFGGAGGFSFGMPSGSGSGSGGASSWPDQQSLFGPGGKASSWSGRISPAHRAISAATRSRASSGSHNHHHIHGHVVGGGGAGAGSGAGGGGYAAKASRSGHGGSGHGSSARPKKADAKSTSSASARKSASRR